MTSYQEEIERKRKQLEMALDRSDISVFAGEPEHYRNRMDFVFAPGKIGMREKGRWDKVVDMDRSSFAVPRINELLAEVREHFLDADAFDVVTKRGTFRYAVIRAPSEDSSITFILNKDSERIDEAIGRIKAFADVTTANNVLVGYQPRNTDMSVSSDCSVIKGSNMLHEEMMGSTFHYSTQGFFQNNSFMAERMLEYVHGLLEPYDTEDAPLLDLYGGVGTFGITNADQFQRVVIVESVKECIEAARLNAKENHAENVEAYVLPAEDVKQLDLPKRELFAITDPPRAGMHPKVIQSLKGLKPKVLIYVSCNVKQLAKEVPKFRKYSVKSAALFDLFPGTPHSEAVVELVRDDIQEEE